jgi:hypothetical protein
MLGTSIRDTITWTIDKPITFEKSMKNFSIALKTFDGRERTFSADGHDKFFDVIREPTRLVIRPIVPTDLLQ